MGHSSGGPAGHSPALSQSSVPSHATNGQAFHHGLGSGGIADSVARPGLDRIDSGFAEPGETDTSTLHVCMRACVHAYMHGGTQGILCMSAGCGLHAKLGLRAHLRVLTLD